MAGLIPQAFIDDVLHRTDVVELIDSYVPLKKRGNSHTACCPFHNEKSPSFNVVAKKQFYHCFGCGASGNAISFAMNYLHLGFVEAVDTLAQRLGMTVPREGSSEKQQHATDLYQLLSKIDEYYQQQLHQSGKKASDYLRLRGVNDAIAKTYHLGFAPNGWHHVQHRFTSSEQELITTGMLVKNEEGKIYDRYRNRLMFPIHDRHGRIIGFGGRVLDKEQKPKYLNSPETVLFQKSRELYGLHQVLTQPNKSTQIIVVEGYMDVIALAQHGIPYAVATLGTATTTYHIQLLAKHCQHLIFCFDGDAAGKQAAWRALESSLAHVHAGLDATFMFLPQDHDPDSLVRLEGPQGFLHRLEQALPLHRFLFDTLSKDLNLTNPAGKTQLINLSKPLLQKIPEGSYKELLVEDLSRLTHIDTDRLHRMLTDRAALVLKERTSIARTPMRIALALLLQNPELYLQTSSNIDYSELDNEEHQILITLIKQLAANPQANTAKLLEPWRDTPYFDAINNLASWDHQVPELELVKEYVDIIIFLQKHSREQLIRDLIAKSRQGGLTETEKLKLQNMLKERHRFAEQEK